MEQINLIEALAANLGVEVVPAILEPASLEDFIGGQGHFFDAVGELIGVPAVLRITAVGIDAAENTQRDGCCNLVMKAMTGQGFRGSLRC